MRVLSPISRTKTPRFNSCTCSSLVFSIKQDNIHSHLNWICFQQPRDFHKYSDTTSAIISTIDRFVTTLFILISSVSGIPVCSQYYSSCISRIERCNNINCANFPNRYCFCVEGLFCDGRPIFFKFLYRPLTHRFMPFTSRHPWTECNLFFHKMKSRIFHKYRHLDRSSCCRLLRGGCSDRRIRFAGKEKEESCCIEEILHDRFCEL